MRKRIVWSLIGIASIFIAAFILFYKPEPTIKPIPTGSVEHFYSDSQEVVKLFIRKSEDLSPLSEDEKRIIKDFSDKYFRNPRLDEKQEDLQREVSMLDTTYFLYQYNKDRKDAKDIAEANDAINMFFDILKKFNEDGSLKEE